MKILMHICCAPCLIYPLEQLRKKGFAVSGLFYNPNIYPFSEYAKRRQALEDYVKISGIEVFYPQYESVQYHEAIKGKEECPERCSLCWALRMRKAAAVAKEKGFNYFSTTLLVSPHQDQESIKRIGMDIANEEGIDFYYEDFRPGYREAHDLAKAKGIYRQKYCGCIYSQQDLCRKPARP